MMRLTHNVTPDSDKLSPHPSVQSLRLTPRGGIVNEVNEDLFDYSVPLELNRPLLKNLLLNTIKRILCFDYSLQLLYMGGAISQLQNDEGDSTDYQAASTLGVYITNSGVTIALYALIPFVVLGIATIKKIVQAQEDKVDSNGDKLIHQQEFTRLARNALLIGIAPALGSMALTFFSERICNTFGQDPEVSRLVGQFSRPITAMIPIFMVRFMNDWIMIFHGKTNLMIGVTLGCWAAFGIGLGNALTFGRWIFPKLGLYGVLAGFFGQIFFSTLMLSSLIKFKPEFSNYSFTKGLFKKSHQDHKQLEDLLPMSATYEATIITELLSQLANNLIIGQLGASQLAAQNYPTLISFFSLLFNHGLVQAMQPELGGIAEGDYGHARQAVKYTLALSALLPLAPYLIMSMWPNWLIELMGNDLDEDVHSYAIHLIPLQCLASWLFSLQFVMTESIKFTKNYHKHSFLGLLSLWAGTGISYLLAKQYDYDVYGVAYGTIAGSGLALATMMPKFYKEFIRAPSRNLEIEAKSFSESLLPKEARSGSDSGSDDYINELNPDPQPVSVATKSCSFFGCLSRLYNRFTASPVSESKMLMIQ